VSQTQSHVVHKIMVVFSLSDKEGLIENLFASHSI